MTNSKASTTHEVHNPSFNDMTLDEQIDQGVNDWMCLDRAGRQFIGQSRKAAEKMRADYNLYTPPGESE